MKQPPTRRSWSLVVGATIVTVVALVALASLVWTPQDPTLQSIPDRFQTPSWAHWLGTDRYGRDVASMMMTGAWNSLSVALVAVAIGIVIGVPLGLTAALNRGWRDDLLMRTADVAFAFPALLLAIMITALAGPGATNAMIAIGIFNVPVFLRVTRGASVQVLARPFALAAQAIGRGPSGIALHHVLPNIANTLMVQATIQFSLAVLAEAALSYFGLGAQPPAATWGRMLADAQSLVGIAPQLAIIPGLAITVTVLGLNLLGDGLRDRFDPRLR